MIYTGDKERTVLIKNTFLGYEFIIMSYGTHPCAYVKIPSLHPFLSSEKYDDCEYIPLSCHGGITFRQCNFDVINHERSSSSYIGWDYAHAGDLYYTNNFLGFSAAGDHRWRTEEIINEVKSVIRQIIDYNKEMNIKIIHSHNQDIAVEMTDINLYYDEYREENEENKR